MPILWVLVVALIISGGIMMRSSDEAQSAADHSTIDTLSQSLLVYRSAVAEFAKLNPSFTGSPADSALNLPPWFRKPTILSSYISAGQAYTFIPDDTPGLQSALIAATESAAIGMKRAGMFVTPTSQYTGISLPAFIPEGAVVALN